MPSKTYANKPYFSKSSANERLVRGYPTPMYHGLFVDFMLINEMSMSETVCLMLKNFFDSMSEADKSRIRQQAELKRHEVAKK